MKRRTLAEVEDEAQERKAEFAPAEYAPEAMAMILRPGTADIVQEFSFADLKRVAYLCGIGWTPQQAFEGIGLTSARMSDLTAQAQQKADDGGAKAALAELAKAVRFGQIQWREWLSLVVRRRIELDESQTLAVLAAKQASGLDWAEKRGDTGDGGPIKVEVTHRILTKEGEEIKMVDKEAAVDIAVEPVRG